MDVAPKRPRSHSGQSPYGATPKPGLPCIRVLGERHTGTRALEAMIDALEYVSTRPRLGTDKTKRAELEAMKAVAELEAKYRNPGRNQAHQRFLDAQSLAKPRAACWKHARLEWDESYMQLVGVILARRNPYSWLFALFARPYHQIGPRVTDFSDFIQQPWITIPRERMVEAVESPAALWVEKMAAAHAFKTRAEIPVAWQSFEPFLADPVASLSQNLAILGQSSEGLTAVQRHTKTNEPLEILQRRHAKEPWKQWLSASQVAKINEGLDANVVQDAGYHIENPEDYPAKLSAEGEAGLASYVDLNRLRRQLH